LRSLEWLERFQGRHRGQGVRQDGERPQGGYADRGPEEKREKRDADECDTPPPPPSPATRAAAPASLRRLHASRLYGTVLAGAARFGEGTEECDNASRPGDACSRHSCGISSRADSSPTSPTARSSIVICPTPQRRAPCTWDSIPPPTACT